MSTEIFGHQVGSAALVVQHHTLHEILLAVLCRHQAADPRLAAEVVVEVRGDHSSHGLTHKCDVPHRTAQARKGCVVEVAGVHHGVYDSPASVDPASSRAANALHRLHLSLAPVVGSTAVENEGESLLAGQPPQHFHNACARALGNPDHEQVRWALGRAVRSSSPAGNCPQLLLAFRSTCCNERFLSHAVNVRTRRCRDDLGKGSTMDIGSGDTIA